MAKGDGHFDSATLRSVTWVGVEQPHPGIYPKFTNFYLPPIPMGGVWGSASVCVVCGLSRGAGGRGLSLGGGGGGGSGDGVSDDSTVFDLKFDPRAYTEGAGKELLREQVLDLVLDDTP